jgi:glutathione peroxidase
MFSKIDVKGANQAPIYKFLTDRRRNGRTNQVPSWNFAKYLVDENGHVIRYFAPSINPMDSTVVNAILH